LLYNRATKITGKIAHRATCKDFAAMTRTHTGTDGRTHTPALCLDYHTQAQTDGRIHQRFVWTTTHRHRHRHRQTPNCALSGLPQTHTMTHARKHARMHTHTNKVTLTYTSTHTLSYTNTPTHPPVLCLDCLHALPGLTHPHRPFPGTGLYPS